MAARRRSILSLAFTHPTCTKTTPVSTPKGVDFKAIMAEEEHSQKIAHFQDVTGIDDTARSRAVLSAHNWDLEASVQDILNLQEGSQPVFNSPQPAPSIHPSSDPPPPPLANLSRPRISRPILLNAAARPPVGWWEWTMGWALAPVRLILYTTNELLQFVVHLLFGSEPTPARNPIGDVQRFITDFEEDYGTVHPDFLELSYGSALEKAKQDLNFLLVYVHSAGHHDTPTFCREVLSSQQLVDFLASRQCLCWAVSVNSEEGARVSYTLRETTYPFLAFVVLKGTRMTIIGRQEGITTTEDLITKLDLLITNNDPELVVLRADRHQRSLDQQLRQQQEEEFQKSLLADQEKDQRRQAEQRLAEQAAEEEQQRVLDLQRQEESFKQQCKLKAERLPPEPDSTDTTAVHIVFKLPNDSRIERRFSPTDKIESVYDFVYSHEEVPRVFSLFTNYPRKELICENGGGPLLNEVGLSRKCLLFVHDKTED